MRSVKKVFPDLAKGRTLAGMGDPETLLPWPTIECERDQAEATHTRRGFSLLVRITQGAWVCFQGAGSVDAFLHSQALGFSRAAMGDPPALLCQCVGLSVSPGSCWWGWRPGAWPMQIWLSEPVTWPPGEGPGPSCACSSFRKLRLPARARASCCSS